MKRMIIAAALALGLGQVRAAEFSDLAVGSEEIATSADAAKIPPTAFPAPVMTACPPGLEVKYLKLMEDLANAYTNRLISRNHYRLSQAAVGYAEGWSYARVEASLDLAADVLRERTGDVLYHSRSGKSAAAHSGAGAAGTESVKSQHYPPELVARLYSFYDVLANAYVNRLITGGHFHFTDAAIMNAQKYGPGAVEHTLDLSLGFLKESMSAGKWTAIGGK